tara:strand:+ start:110 stop:328 length:219 start_codon:yes stop_codon:yes gene_type:complete
MNKNLELVYKSLDTINPDWKTALIANVTESGFEYDIFTKTDDEEEKENLAVMLALVAKKSIQELDNLEWSEN